MRSLAAGVLLVVFAVLLPTLNLGTWAERVIFDEDTFVATVDGILDEPAVQQALAERIADRIVEEIDVPSATTRLLTEVRAELGTGESPGSVALLAGPLERGARELLVRASLAVMEQRADGIYVGLEEEAAHTRTIADVMVETMVEWE